MKQEQIKQEENSVEKQPLVNHKSVKRDSILVLSGGMDSVTMLHEFRAQIALAVSFDYGANHNKKELACAKAHCEALGVEHLVIDLGFIKAYFKSSLLEGAEAIPEGHYAEDNMKSTVVPFRNGIMLAISCGLAESRQLTKVMLANHAGDHTVYPDCRPSFIKAMSAAMGYGTFEGVEIEAPYTTISKAEIARHGKVLGLDYATTWSCYKGGDKHCGLCGTCIERKEAMALAGIKDTTAYES